MSHIKQEHVNSPPRAITPLPPATHQITMDEYQEREKNHYYRNATKDASVKKVVLSLLEDHPGMWQNGNRFQPEKWRTLGVDVYKRTGHIVCMNDMRKMLVMGKAVLKKKIAFCIRNKKMHRAATEAELWKWEYYRHFLYYRETLGQFEANLREKQSTGEDQNQDEDEDDVIYDGIIDNVIFSSHNSTGHVSNTVKVKDEPHYDAGLQSPEVLREEALPQMDMGSSASNFSSATQSHSQNRRSSSIDYTEDDRSAQHIAEQAKRLFLQYPEMSNLIRETMFKTIRLPTIRMLGRFSTTWRRRRRRRSGRERRTGLSGSSSKATRIFDNLVFFFFVIFYFFVFAALFVVFFFSLISDRPTTIPVK